MARGRIRFASMIMLAGAITSSCGDSNSNAGQERPTIKKSGTLDPSDFAHPLVQRPGTFQVTGCCTLAVSAETEVERLNSDIFAARISGNQWRTELLFGPDVKSPAGEDMKPTTRRTLDGVAYQRFDLGAEPGAKQGARYVWSAEVPLAAKAEARGVIRPTLRINGWCRSAAACQQLVSAMNSIRF